MNATTGQDNWYLAREGKQHGPLSDLEMTKLAELGHLRASDLVWRPGFADWMPAPSVFPDSQAAEPPPAPARPAEREPQAGSAAAGQPAAAQPQPASRGPQQAKAAQGFGAAAHPGAQGPGAHASGAAQGTGFIPAQHTAAQGFQAGGYRPSAAPGTEIPVTGRPDTQPFSTSPQSGMRTEAAPHNPAMTLEPMAPAATAKGGGRRGAVVALSLLALVGGAGAAAYLYGDAIKAALSGGASPATEATPVIEAPDPVSASPAASPAAAPVAAPPATPPVDTAAIDGELQKSPMWSLLKVEFPDWYAERLREVGQLKSAGKSDDDINAQLSDAVVALRRQNANTALAASPARLQEIASAFIANLTSLQSQSVDACYGFISKGETTPVAASLMQKPVEGAPLHAQLQAVFAAVAEGRRSPTPRKSPEKSDYDLLATELGTIGWSQADIQLFADPKALSEAPRERVCKMVRDWFSAHLAVKDEAARERLLFETLRPVVAG